VDELERDRQVAIARFVEKRLAEGTAEYLKKFRATHGLISRLFRDSDDLRKLTGTVLCREVRYVHAARFITSPPTSSDDLKTLLSANPFVRRLEPTTADRLAELLSRLADPVRFGWLREGRAPSPAERRMAIRWTTSLWAIERIRTGRRMESSSEQQSAVEHVLSEDAQSTRVDLPVIDALEDLKPGNFTNETYLSGVKCDVPVRLFNRRLLAIECKVSNSAVNSIKRLNHEVGKKAAAWREAFGSRVYPAAVLDGVFALRNLQAAQADGITIFWAHRLEELVDSVKLSDES
jgi:hypothetical protein